MSEMTMFDLLVKLWPLILYALILAAFVGGQRIQIVALHQDMKQLSTHTQRNALEVEALETKINLRMYKDNLPLFVPSVTCREHIRNCEERSKDHETVRAREHTELKTAIKDISTQLQGLNETMIRHMGEASGAQAARDGQKKGGG
jgi:hypothetical protein